MKKKVIIIEGCDRTGKDTLIAQLHNHFNGSIELHAGIPNTTGSLFDFYYNGLIHSTLDHYYNSEAEAIIHNRSIYGEYVYGPKYRNESKDYVSDIISKLESGQLNTFIPDDELYLILLTSSGSDLLVNNDDGLSYSSKKSDIEDEIEAFNEVFNLSSIKNKKRILVNNVCSFRNKDDIYNEVLNFIS